MEGIVNLQKYKSRAVGFCILATKPGTKEKVEEVQPQLPHHTQQTVQLVDILS